MSTSFYHSAIKVKRQHQGMIEGMRDESGKTYWPAATLLIVTIGYFWPALFGDEIFQFRDLFYFHYPLRHYWATVIHDGEMPFLNIALNGGQPILANPNYATFYPPAWLYVVLPFDTAWNLIFIAHVFWGALGMYWLVRLHHCQRLPAFCAAITFGFSGTFLSCLNYSNMAIAGSWLPWVSASTIQAFFIGGKWVPATVILLSLQFLSGEPTVSVITALIISTGWLIGTIQSVQRRKLLLRGVLILALCSLLIAVQLIPAMLWLPHSARGAGLDVMKSALFWSLHPARLIELLVPDYYGNVMSPLLKDYWGGSFSDTGYPYILRFYCGCIALLVAPLAWGHSRGKAALLTAAIGLALALGRWFPGLEHAYTVIPFFQFVRYPEKFLLMFTFGLAFASALGLNEWILRGRIRHLVMVFTALVVPALIFAMYPFPAKMDVIQRALQVKALLSALLYLVAAAFILFLHSRPNLRGLFRFALPAFVVLNIVSYTIDIAETQPHSLLRTPNPVLTAFPSLLHTQILHRGEEQTDLIFASKGDPTILLRESLYPFSGLPYGIRYGATSDIDRMGSREGWKRQIKIRKTFPDSSALHLMRRASITTVLSLESISSPELSLQGKVAIAGGTKNVFVYKVNPDAELPVRWDDGNGKVKWYEKTRNHLLIDVEAHQKGNLLIARNAIPGWRCKLDQKPLNTSASSEGFLIIRVPEGKHKIDLRYVPPGFHAGAAISSGALVVCLIMLIRNKKKREIKEMAEPKTNEAGQ